MIVKAKFAKIIGKANLRELFWAKPAPPRDYPEKDLVFLAHPISGNIDHNLTIVELWAKLAIKKELCPVAPYFLTLKVLSDQNLSDRDEGIQLGLEVLLRCDLLWVCGGKVTSGMAREIAFARKNGIRVVYMDISMLRQIND